MMDPNSLCLEVNAYYGEGYQPLVSSGSWRVAVLNYLDELQPDNIKTLERHQETDEVFVILEGRAILIISGNDTEVKALSFVPMEQSKAYNVKINTWHGLLMSRDARIMIVENANTGEENSQHIALPENLRTEIQLQASSTLLWNG